MCYTLSNVISFFLAIKVLNSSIEIVLIYTCLGLSADRYFQAVAKNCLADCFAYMMYFIEYLFLHTIRAMRGTLITPPTCGLHHMQVLSLCLVLPSHSRVLRLLKKCANYQRYVIFIR